MSMVMPAPCPSCGSELKLISDENIEDFTLLISLGCGQCRLWKTKRVDRYELEMRNSSVAAELLNMVVKDLLRQLKREVDASGWTPVAELDPIARGSRVWGSLEAFDVSEPFNLRHTPPKEPKESIESIIKRGATF